MTRIPQSRFGWLCGLAFACFAGCASPDSRIQKNPDLFAQFPAEAQAKIRAGEIDIGFTGPMVQMALGRPSRVYQRKSESGSQEVWSYRELSPGYYGHSYGYTRLCPVYRTCSRHNCPYFHHPHSYPPRSLERIRVTFEEERVSTIEILDSERGKP